MGTPNSTRNRSLSLFGGQLNYYILISEGEPERYGVKIIEKNSGEQAMAFDLTTEAQRIYALVDKLSRNSVTPSCY